MIKSLLKENKNKSKVFNPESNKIICLHLIIHRILIAQIIHHLILQIQEI
jgi:hypothetical protein